MHVISPANTHCTPYYKLSPNIYYYKNILSVMIHLIVLDGSTFIQVVYKKYITSHNNKKQTSKGEFSCA